MRKMRVKVAGSVRSPTLSSTRTYGTSASSRLKWCAFRPCGVSSTRTARSRYEPELVEVLPVGVHDDLGGPLGQGAPDGPDLDEIGIGHVVDLLRLFDGVGLPALEQDLDVVEVAGPLEAVLDDRVLREGGQAVAGERVERDLVALAVDGLRDERPGRNFEDEAVAGPDELRPAIRVLVAEALLDQLDDLLVALLDGDHRQAVEPEVPERGARPERDLVAVDAAAGVGAERADLVGGLGHRDGRLQERTGTQHRQHEQCDVPAPPGDRAAAAHADCPHRPTCQERPL